MLTITPEIWIISDTHFGHGRIVQYSNRPQNHNEIMLEMWREYVKPEDTVLHIGDVAMTGPNAAWLFPLVKALPGAKYLLRGNHDTGTKRYYLERLGFTVLDSPRPSRSRNGMQGGRLYVTVPAAAVNTRSLQSAEADERTGKELRVAISHCPIGKEPFDWDVNIHGHIHTNGYPLALYKSGRDYRNISVEVVGYRPVRLSEVLAGEYQSPLEAGVGHDARLKDLDG